MGTFVLDEDDRPIGRILSRREILGLLGGSAILAACGSVSAPSTYRSASAAATTAAGRTGVVTSTGLGTGVVVFPSCVVRPALTEGPYFVDEKLNRSDIRSEPSTNAVKPGVLLGLTFLVSRVSGTSCTALASATVDVWHCDALGVYSDATDPSFGSTKGTKFLRGYQTTDAGGKAAFTTIWPGWYQGRATHIHFKVRAAAANGQVSEFTSQLFFDETLNDQVYALAPYSQKSGTRLRNTGDGIFQQSGGKLTITPLKTADGYAATFDIGLAA
jgi:protocatechuate 3,4-dioxygenase beta subunit